MGTRYRKKTNDHKSKKNTKQINKKISNMEHTGKSRGEPMYSRRVSSSNLKYTPGKIFVGDRGEIYNISVL